ncbi:MAG: helix-turn-helix domain-containing protein [Bacillota bacterium]
MKNLVTIGFSPPKFFGSNLHAHSQWELIYYTSGAGTLDICGCEYPFRAHDIIIEPPNAPHREYSGSEYSNIYVRFSHFGPAESGPLLFHDTPEKDFHTVLILLHKEFHLNRKNSPGIIESLMHVLHQYIISWQQERPSNAYTEQFINNLIANFSNPAFQIRDAMRKVPFTPDHFRRLFKKETGLTPAEYLTRLRVDCAKQHLADKRMTIKETATLCGYKDPYYFSRVFKRNTHKNPSEW